LGVVAVRFPKRVVKPSRPLHVSYEANRENEHEPQKVYDRAPVQKAQSNREHDNERQEEHQRGNCPKGVCLSRRIVRPVKVGATAEFALVAQNNPKARPVHMQHPTEQVVSNDAVITRLCPVAWHRVTAVYFETASSVPDVPGNAGSRRRDRRHRDPMLFAHSELGRRHRAVTLTVQRMGWMFWNQSQLAGASRRLLAQRARRSSENNLSQHTEETTLPMTPQFIQGGDRRSHDNGSPQTGPRQIQRSAKLDRPLEFSPPVDQNRNPERLLILFCKKNITMNVAKKVA